jgi:hypothetical protein
MPPFSMLNTWKVAVTGHEHTQEVRQTWTNGVKLNINNKRYKRDKKYQEIQS